MTVQNTEAAKFQKIVDSSPEIECTLRGRETQECHWSSNMTVLEHGLCIKTGISL